MAVATLKKDGMFFLAGLSVGIIAFGENIDHFFTHFWNSSFLGRFTLPEMLGLPIGVIVFLVVIMALLLFWLVEVVEDRINKTENRREHLRGKLWGAGAITLVALIVMVMGQPTMLDKWNQIAAEDQPLLDKREVQIEPAELLNFIANDLVQVVLLDVRAEADFNLFHLRDAQRVDLADLPEMAEKDFLNRPGNTLFVVMSNDEGRATDAWKILKAESIENTYILEGGINNWLALYNEAEAVHDEKQLATYIPVLDSSIPAGQDLLQYRFDTARGDNYAAADPDPHHYETEYTHKVKMKVKKAAGGG